MTTVPPAAMQTQTGPKTAVNRPVPMPAPHVVARRVDTLTEADLAPLTGPHARRDPDALAKLRDRAEGVARVNIAALWNGTHANPDALADALDVFGQIMNAKTGAPPVPDELEAVMTRAVRAALVDAPPPPAAFRKAEAARYIGLSERTLDQLVKGGEIRPARKGRAVLFLREQLDGFLRASIPRRG